MKEKSIHDGDIWRRIKSAWNIWKQIILEIPAKLKQKEKNIRQIRKSLTWKLKHVNKTHPKDDNIISQENVSPGTSNLCYCVVS